MYADKIVLLADVNADLAAQCRRIDPTWGIDEVMKVAIKVVHEATSVNAPHFVCQGEPALAMWANMIASPHVFPFNMNEAKADAYVKYMNENKLFVSCTMTCLQSTTKRKLISETYKDNGEVTKIPVFKHVQWRELF